MLALQIIATALNYTLFIPLLKRADVGAVDYSSNSYLYLNYTLVIPLLKRANVGAADYSSSA